MYNSQYLHNYRLQYLQWVVCYGIYIISNCPLYLQFLQVMSFAGHTFRCPFVNAFPNFMHVLLRSIFVTFAQILHSDGA